VVKGLDVFREHFRDFANCYVLIGGTACDLVMGEVGLSFRATKDLDIVLCTEALDADFARAFWAFVRQGEFQVQEKATGERQFYRFQKPKRQGYPFMLELFSRVPDALSVADESHLTPIPVGEMVSSLSAILLSDAYYHWIHAGKRWVQDLYIVGPEHLIPLKAKAWLDLSERRARGEAVDSKTIRKHRNDVFRLFPVLNPQPMANVPETIGTDLGSFLTAMEKEQINLKSLGVGSRTKTDVLTNLRSIYGLC